MWNYIINKICKLVYFSAKNVLLLDYRVYQVKLYKTFPGLTTCCMEIIKKVRN